MSLSGGLATVSESDPPLPIRVLSHPARVPLAQFQKEWRFWTNHNPYEFRFIAEMNDVRLVVLFFDRDAIIRAFVDKSSYLQRVRRSQARMDDYFRDHRGIKKRFDQVLKICFFDKEAT
jgi:hypothetical protein